MSSSESAFSQRFGTAALELRRRTTRARVCVAAFRDRLSLASGKKTCLWARPQGRCLTAKALESGCRCPQVPTDT